jgi:hypothetical protein
MVPNGYQNPIFLSVVPKPAKLVPLSPFVVPNCEQNQGPSLYKKLQHMLELFAFYQADNLASRLRFRAYCTLEAVKMVKASQMNINEMRWVNENVSL